MLCWLAPSRPEYVSREVFAKTIIPAPALIKRILGLLMYQQASSTSVRLPVAKMLSTQSLRDPPFRNTFLMEP